MASTSASVGAGGCPVLAILDDGRWAGPRDTAAGTTSDNYCTAWLVRGSFRRCRDVLTRRRMDELSLAIVGIDYPNDDKSKSNRRMELLLTAPGEPVDLRSDRKNTHDPDAIGIYTIRGVQVGYLSAERAPWIGKRMQSEDFVALFQQLHGNVAYLRVRFGGGEPTLPPPAPPLPIPARPRPLRVSPPVIDPDTFYPDEDGPEWGA
jgi:hypothetical protein